jgi:hypothetical protein
MLVTQAGTGYNGILWDSMGKRWETSDFGGFSMADLRDVPGLFRAPGAVDKSVYSTTRAPLLLKAGK